MKQRHLVLLLVICSGWASSAGASVPANKGKVVPVLVETKYQRLASGPLARAAVADLPAGVVLAADGLTITVKDISAEIEKAPAMARDQLRKYKFFVLERLAVHKVIAAEAKTWAAKKGMSKSLAESDLIAKYLESITSGIKVSDDEIARLYKQNPDLIGPFPLEKVKAELRTYLQEQKQRQAIADHIDSIGSRRKIKVSDAWTRQQYALWIKNPVEQARRSGRPTLVDFGADGCRPCDMMSPILKELRAEHKGKLNIVFVHVRKEQVLAAHYSISSIPVQIFFDKNGRETFRHVGFFDKKSIEQKLLELGVK